MLVLTTVSVGRQVPYILCAPQGRSTWISWTLEYNTLHQLTLWPNTELCPHPPHHVHVSLLQDDAMCVPYELDGIDNCQCPTI